MRTLLLSRSPSDQYTTRLRADNLILERLSRARVFALCGRDAFSRTRGVARRRVLGVCHPTALRHIKLVVPPPTDCPLLNVHGVLNGLFNVTLRYTWH